MRIDWIDRAKGIGILLVILGHMSIPEIASRLIYAFHMPLFFYLSGLTVRYNNFKGVVIKYFRYLIWPYITFSVFSNILYNINLFGLGLQVDYSALLLGIESINTPLWFLTALFSAHLLNYLANKYLEKTTIKLISIPIIFAVLVMHAKLPLNFDVAALVLLFMNLPMLGSLNYKSIYLYTALLFLAALSNERVDLYDRTLGLVPLWLLSSYSGIRLVEMFSRSYFAQFFSRVFLWLGQRSLLLLALHPLVPSVLRNLEVIGNGMLSSLCSLIVVLIIADLMFRNAIKFWKLV